MHWFGIYLYFRKRKVERSNGRVIGLATNKIVKKHIKSLNLNEKINNQVINLESIYDTYGAYMAV